MAKRLAVQLNLERIRTNLSREDGRPFTAAEVQRWLLDAGFEPRGDLWLVEEKDLGQLDPSEVISADDFREDRR